MSGDQRNLKLQGAWNRVSRPIARISIPMSLSQTGIAIQTSPSGSPEENISNVTTASRFERTACFRLSQVLSRSVIGWEEVDG